MLQLVRKKILTSFILQGIQIPNTHWPVKLDVRVKKAKGTVNHLGIPKCSRSVLGLTFCGASRGVNFRGGDNT